MEFPHSVRVLLSLRVGSFVTTRITLANCKKDHNFADKTFTNHAKKTLPLQAWLLGFFRLESSDAACLSGCTIVFG